MSGHSFGAVTTQAVSGQSYPVIGQKWTDKRIDAAIPLSPSGSRNATDTANLFSKVAIPWLLMTGTRDTSPIGNLSAESRLNVYPNLPKSIDRYELVLENAQHSVFTERALPNEDKQDKTRHHQSIKAISTAFWDSYLKEDNTAKDWLQGTGAKESLEQKDSWKIAKQE